MEARRARSVVSRHCWGGDVGVAFGGQLGTRPRRRSGSLARVLRVCGLGTPSKRSSTRGSQAEEPPSRHIRVIPAFDELPVCRSSSTSGSYRRISHRPDSASSRRPPRGRWSPMTGLASLETDGASAAKVATGAKEKVVGPHLGTALRPEAPRQRSPRPRRAGWRCCFERAGESAGRPHRG